jgi:putative endonuclease
VALPWIAASPSAPRNDEYGRILVKTRCVYIMAKMRNGVIYTGVTSNLAQRAFQHREGLVEGFSKRNDCKMLVWFEQHATMESAILREKQIKGGSRRKKLALIEALNPQWKDLYEDIAHG